MSKEEKGAGACLICSSDEQAFSIKLTFGKSSGVSERGDFASDPITVDFVLRRLLNFPQEEFYNVLGMEPGQWLQICKNCCQLAVQVKEAYSQILLLENKITELKENAEDIMKQSLNLEKGKLVKETWMDNNYNLYAREYVRDYYKGRLLATKEEIELGDGAVKIEHEESDNKEKTCSETESCSPGDSAPGDDDEEMELEEMPAEWNLLKEEECIISVDPLHVQEAVEDDTQKICPSSSQSVRSNSRSRKQTVKRAPVVLPLDPLHIPEPSKPNDALDSSSSQSVASSSKLRKPIVVKLDPKSKSNSSPATFAKWKCSFCPQRFFEYPQLKLHVFECDLKPPDPPGEPSDRKHKCLRCNAAFPDKTLLNDHYLKHHSKKSIKCDLCDAWVSSWVTMDNHKKKFHNDDPKLKAQCSVCGRKLVNEAAVESHLNLVHRLHRKKKKVEWTRCCHCGENIKNSIIYNKHMKDVHGDLFIFQCDLCPKKYIRECDLKGHKRLGHRADVFN